MKTRLLPVAAVLGSVALLSLSACTPGDGSDEPTRAATSATAESGTVKPGTLLTKKALNATASLPSAAEDWRITYESENAAGEHIVVSGAVAIPKGEAPQGGWPVLSWGHGTTGYADVCAPSAQGDDGLAADDYLDVMRTFVDHWVARGYAVARTDYEGLGTPGGHPYMNALSAANTITDIVRAAAQVNESVGTTWVAMGHSQGGQAAVAAAQYGPGRAPELDLRGAASVAPGGVGLSQTPAWARSAPPGSEAIQPYIPLIVLGAQAGDPSVDADAIMSKKATDLVGFTRAGCPWGQVPAPDAIPMNELFATDADLASLEQYLDAQDPTNLKPQVPVLLQAGKADVEVELAGVQGMRATYCAAGAVVTYRDYEGLDHVPMLVDSGPREEAFAWLDRVVHGKEIENDCV
ncbi:lipase family protein [Nocardioides dubius]|uniref:Alpha/beta fold hydrolase n=1 Tax=Nocardioides dubius TaxID=317019 RepID=A0ABP4E9X8_9ACTN